MLQFHHGLLGKESTLVASNLRSVWQRTSILIRTAQSIQILCLQVGNVVSSQIELGTQARVVNADECLILSRNLDIFLEGEVAIGAVEDDDVVLGDGLLNLVVIGLSVA